MPAVWRQQLTALLLTTTLCGCVPPDFGTPEPAQRAPVPATPAASAPTAPAQGTVLHPVPDLPAGAPGTVEPAPPTRPAPPVSSASQALLAQSRSHQAAGNYEQAAASIERALRIDPRQPVLWLELGNIRLREGDFAQAESLGRKARSLATGDTTLTAQADDLITAARKR